MPGPHPPECANALLARLPEDAYASLLPMLEPVALACKQVVAQRGEPIAHVYFPCTCILSVLTYMEDGSAIEVGTIGREGFFGIDILNGVSDAFAHTFCQAAGECMRMTVADFRREVAQDTPLRRAAQRYVQAYLSLLSQSVACNRLHTLGQRFARWVLMTRDRIDRDDFPLTQEFLAQMLGVRRPSISQTAAAFQRAGIIRYNRGDMTVLDRGQLEQACCECYRVITRQFDQLLAPEPG